MREYKCPVVGCDAVTDTVEQFIDHVETHRTDYEQYGDRPTSPPAEATR